MHDHPSAFVHDGFLFLNMHGKRQLVTDTRARPVSPKPGWEPSSLLNLKDGLSLLLLSRNEEEHALWVIKDKHIFAGDFRKLTISQPHLVNFLYRRLLLLAASTVFRDQEWQALDPRILAILTQGFDYRGLGAVRPLSHFDQPLGSIEGIFQSTRRWFRDFIKGVIKPNSAPDVLAQFFDVEHVRLIPLDVSFRAIALLCVRSHPGKDFIIVSYAAGSRADMQFGFLLNLVDGSIFTDDDLQGRDLVINDLITNIFQIISRAPKNGLALHPIQRGGIILCGRRHFGHGIWDELQALDRLVAVQSSWMAVPVVYVLKERSGAALYGNLDDIYPEIAGQFHYVKSIDEILAHSLKHGVQIFRIHGRRALRATRNRLIHLAQRHGECAGLAKIAEEKFGNTSSRLPIIALGLRLTNRRPVDFLGFYCRLLRFLTDEFGPIGVVIDGMNSDSETGLAATKVFNAVSSNNGEQEINEEIEFVSSLINATSNMPVTFISCVGHAIRDNLFWLSIVDFFIAPLGAGVAKLRWALDVPGFLLVSRKNLKSCLLLDCYSSPRHMDEPFTSLSMNSELEVEDEMLGPPTRGSTKPTQIPHPENFSPDESKVFARISELLKITLQEKISREDNA